MIVKVMLRGQGKTHMALAQDFQDFRIAKIASLRNGRYHLTKGKSQESKNSPGARSRRANRCPSKTVCSSA